MHFLAIGALTSSRSRMCLIISALAALHRGKAVKLPGTRMLIALVLIAVMSLQAAAATVGAYCQHEQDALTQHVGHHDHQHNNAHPAGDNGADPDCGMCQAGLIVGFPSELHLVTLSLPRADPETALCRQAAAPPLDRPERPDWATA